MSAVASLDTRSRFHPLRTPALRGAGVDPSRTRGPSPSLAVFRQTVQRHLRGPFAQRAGSAAEVVRGIRESHQPDACVAILAGEAVHRGGLDGLDLAAGVLAQTPAPLLRVIDADFAEDSRRRRGDRLLGYMRSRAVDQKWGVLLDALARTAPAAMPSAAVWSVLRRVARSATDGMAEGLAVAATRLADRGLADRIRAIAFLRRLIAPRPDGRQVGAAARQIVEGYLADLDD